MTNFFPGRQNGPKWPNMAKKGQKKNPPKNKKNLRSAAWGRRPLNLAGHSAGHSLAAVGWPLARPFAGRWLAIRWPFAGHWLAIGWPLVGDGAADAF